MAGLGSAMAAARTALSGLAALTSSASSSSFTLADGLLRADDEQPTAERRYEVRLGDGGPTITETVSQDAADFLGRFDVVVLYDALADQDALDDRMAEDAAQIIGKLEARASYHADTRRVTCIGTRTDGDGSFVRRVFEFECLYRQAI